MKISYTVEVDEVFCPPKYGLAPDNYDSDKHDVMITFEDGSKIKSNLDWSDLVSYTLCIKKVRTRKFYAYPSKGLPVYLSSLEVAWNWLWYGGKATKFVVEHVYEDDILIDMIVHKDPKG